MSYTFIMIKAGELPMRKFVLMLLCLLSLCLCTVAHADTFAFEDFSATCEIDGSKYTILTLDNLSSHGEWLAARGLTEDALRADWAERGVRVQAWTASGDACLEITAVQDAFAAQYYDVNQVSDEERKTFRLGHSADKDGFYRAQGYDYTSAQWKNMKNTGRFLQLKYTCTSGGESWRGYARKTIRNGYTINVDYKVYGRALKTADQKALDAVMDTWQFVEVFPRPASSVSTLVFTSRPPLETNTGKFTLKGTGSAGLRIIGVVMRMSTSDVKQFDVTIGKSGNFELDIALPREGVWLMTYVVENGTTTVEEGAFDAITYQKDLLPITLNGSLPTIAITGNQLVISGVTMKQTMVQCIVDGRYQKNITTNNSGAFSFTIDTSAEGEYTFTLVFEKKGYATRRFSSTATRTYTDEDRRQMIRESAVSPAYKTLTSKLSGYKGDYMVYTLYIQSVEQTPTGYLAMAGMNRSKAGKYSNMVAIRSTDAPEFVAGDKVRLYLRCIDDYELTNENGTDIIPYFDLQWME